jgi:hypothetical protein
MPGSEALTDFPNIEKNKLVDPSYARYKIRMRLAALAVAFDSLFFLGYKVPVLIEEQRLGNTEPQLHHVATTPNHLAAETVVVGGFGIKSSVPIAEALPQLGQIGGVEALEQDNSGIDADVIAQKIIKDAKESGLTEIGLWTDSNGGNLMSKVALRIQQDDSILRVRFIVFDCLPTSVNALQQDQRNTVDILDAVSSVLPDIATFPPVGYWYTQQQLEGKSSHPSGHYSVGQVLDEMYSPDKPSSTLLAAEALLVVHPTIRNDLKAIADVQDKKPPLIISIRPKSDTGDKVIKSDVSDQELAEMTENANLQRVSVALEGITHGDPTANREAYQRAITDIIIPAIEEYDRSIGTRLYRIDSVR